MPEGNKDLDKQGKAWEIIENYEVKKKLHDIAQSLNVEEYKKYLDKHGIKPKND